MAGTLAEERSMNGKAKTLSVSALSKAVSQAVAAEQQKSAIGTAFISNHPIIMGRWFDGKLELAEAEALSTRITQHVERSGVARDLAGEGAKALQPAFMWHGGHIICGFIMENAHSLAE